MNGLGLIGSLVVGALAGGLAGRIMKGRGFGCLGNIAIGMVGALLGAFVFGVFGLSAHGFIGTLIMALIGALILIYLVRLIRN